MRTIGWLLLLLAVSAGPLSADDSPGPWVGSADARKFGANLFFVEDLKAFLAAWAKPGDPARIQMVSSVGPGSSVEAVVVFWGCSPDKQGKCQLFAELSILDADGKILGTGPAKPIWTQPPPPKGQLSVGQTSVSLAPTGDPATLTVRSVVTDRVSNDSVTLAVPLEYR